MPFGLSGLDADWRSAPEGARIVVPHDECVNRPVLTKMGDGSARHVAIDIKHCSFALSHRPPAGPWNATTARPVQVREPMFGSALRHWHVVEPQLGDLRTLLKYAGIKINA